MSPKYQVVIANPPYLGGKGMNAGLGEWAKKNYPDSKSDLFAMFIERGTGLVIERGYSAMVTMQSWMFLSSYEALRNNIIGNYYISTLIQIGYNSFPDLNSKIAQACAFVFVRASSGAACGALIDLNDAPQAADKNLVFLEKLGKNEICYLNQSEFKKVPGTPIAFSISEAVREIFNTAPKLKDFGNTRQGLATGENDRFLRFWHEVASSTANLHARPDDTASDVYKWFPCNKGGPYRKWYGNTDYFVNWQNDDYEIRNFVDAAGKLRSRPQNIDYYFRQGITWSSLSSSSLSMRFSPEGSIFETKGAMYFAEDETILKYILGFANTKLANVFLSAISPTCDEPRRSD